MQLHNSGWRVFALETVVFDKELSIAGMPDAVFYRERPGSSVPVLCVVDWKCSSADPMRTSTPLYCNSPIRTLTNTSFTSWSIQTGLYARMLRQGTGLEVESCFAVQIDTRDEGRGLCIWTLNKVEKEIESMAQVWRDFLRLSRVTRAWEKGEGATEKWMPRESVPEVFGLRGEAAGDEDFESFE